MMIVWYYGDELASSVSHRVRKVARLLDAYYIKVKFFKFLYWPPDSLPLLSIHTHQGMLG